MTRQPWTGSTIPGLPPAATAVALAISIALTAPAAAQDFDRIAPKEPPANPPAAMPAVPAAPDATRGGTRPLVPALKGLRFVSSADRVRPGGVIAEGVDGAGMDLLDTLGFHAVMAPFLGQPLTLDRLNEIARRTVLWYRDNDRPLVDVVVPEQNISNGSVQILVIEFVAGAIRTEGNRWFSDAALLDAVRTRPGERISGQSLLDDVNWLNRNPFRQVDLVYQRSEKVGASDIVLRTADRFPLRVFAGYENTGSASTERSRTLAGLNWGNAFWLDHQLSYQFTTSPDYWRNPLNRGSGKAHFTSHSGSYLVPLPWRHTLTLFGSYAESLPALPDSFAQTGRSSQVSARYSVPLGGGSGFSHEAQVGFDWKRSNNDLEFGGLSVSATSTDVAQWMAGYGASLTDDWGATSLSATVFHGPGGVTDRNSTTAFQSQRAGAEARYGYVRVGLDRLTRLPESFSWLTRIQGQLANRPLMPSEQLGFGGDGSVRGYDERVVNGDQGLLISNELRTPEFSLSQALGERDLGDSLQFLAFWDYGLAANRGAGSPSEPRRSMLSGAGIGLRLALPPYLALKFDYGWTLHDPAGVSVGKGRPHLALTISY